MTFSTEEVWRGVPGHEDRYQVSNLGRVRSLDRRVNARNGSTRLVKGQILTPKSTTKSHPYLCVTLGVSARGIPVHQLVALAFIGPRPVGPGARDIRHLDGNPTNNRADNLAYGSREENIRDIYNDGNAWKKLTAADVEAIRKRLATGESHATIAADYGVDKSHVSAIKRGRVYAWLKDA